MHFSSPFLSPHLCWLKAIQAASGLANFNIEDSPAKKLKFEPVGKENADPEDSIVDDVGLKKPQLDLVKTRDKPAAVPTIKDLEAEEPILKENPHRFVLFPIKYHEVGILTRPAYSGLAAS